MISDKSCTRCSEPITKYNHYVDARIKKDGDIYDKTTAKMTICIYCWRKLLRDAE